MAICTQTEKNIDFVAPCGQSNVNRYIKGHGVTFGAATSYCCADHVHNCHLELLAASYWVRGRVIGAQLPHHA